MALFSEYLDDPEKRKRLEALITENERIIKFAHFNLLKYPDISKNLAVRRYTLLDKIIKHAVTQHTLLKGYQIQLNKNSDTFYDSHSVNALQRTIMENYLVFHAIFVYPKTEKECLFRYNIYQYVDRESNFQKTSAITSDQVTLKKFDLAGFTEVIKPHDIKFVLSSVRDMYYEKVISDPLFNTLNKEQKNKITGKRKNWKIDGNWHDLAKHAGFNESIFAYKYDILSSYVHSGANSTSSINYLNVLENDNKISIIGNLLDGIPIICKALLEYFEITNQKALIKKDTEIFNMIKEKCIFGILEALFIEEINEYCDSY